jgi:hypothetical protein
VTCVRCGYDSGRRERAGLEHCPSCGRAFALDKSEHGVTDLAFKNAVEAVSEYGRLAWTARQLYYEVARWRRRRNLVTRLLRLPYVSLERAAFDAMLVRWEKVHWTLPRRLATGAFAPPLADDGLAPDLADYAFERIVVCDRKATADVLLANAFHIEHRCAVFTVDGYPQHAFERIAPALRREPPRAVIVVHDADPAGCGLADRVAADPRWALDGARVVDAGIRPRAAKRFRGLYTRAEPDAASLSARDDEARWLRKYRLDLDVMKPRGLMLALAAAVASPLDELAAGAAATAGGVVLAEEAGWWDSAARDTDDDYPG